MRSAIPKLRTFASLVTFSHTIFALPFAAAAVVLSLPQPRLPLTAARLVAMGVCLVAARTAAMAFNRYVDRDIDAHNPRTAAREIPAGVIEPRTALGLTLGASALFLAAAATLGYWPTLLALPVLGVLLGYSLTKRFTWAAHLVLGLALALAPGGAWLATGASPGVGIVFLMGAVLTWVAGFDVLYSLQDEAFDRKIGLHSIPVRFGSHGALILSALLHVMTVLALMGTGRSFHRGPLYFMGVILIGLLLLYEHLLIGKGNLARINRAFFTVNGYVGLVFFLLTASDVFFFTLAPGSRR